MAQMFSSSMTNVCWQVFMFYSGASCTLTQELEF